MNTSSDKIINLEAPKTDFEVQDQSMNINRTDYEIFIKLGLNKFRENCEFSEDATIEHVITSIVEAKREIFKNENANNFELFIAKKDGEAKDDYPGLLISNGQISENCIVQS